MTDPPHDEPEKKIIVDEDWKSRVQAEKEALERKQQQRQQDEEPASAAQAEPDASLPPASLEVLAGSLAMQAMIAMGLMRVPEGGKPEVHLDQAKHFVDTIAMLEEKTEGNRTPEETVILSNLLHELRMAYLAVQQRQADG
ncbi:MAG TPA: DUF1844 domain-containing protein [Thermoguttaceae bacterium]|nr:DUF1844 domain-containing protein [Thermoguttaceae bacterium]